MAEREIDTTDPGSISGGSPAWLTNPNATPPTPEPGYKWFWYTGDQSPRWIYVPTSWTPPRPATTDAGPAATTTTPTGFARADRDQLTWGNTGRMEGFQVGSTYGGDLKARNSVKNTFGRIASRYASKPSSLDLILNDPDFKRAFPNAKRVGADNIDFGGVQSDFESGTPVGIIDVLTEADPTSDTARGWWWGYDAGGTGPTTARPSAVAPTTTPAASMSADAWLSQYGRSALARPPEERGWSTLAELGLSGQYAGDTPEEIYRRNAADAPANTAQWYDMGGPPVPKYEDRWVQSRGNQRLLGNLLGTAGFLVAPGKTTLGNLLGGAFQAFRQRR